MALRAEAGRGARRSAERNGREGPAVAGRKDPDRGASGESIEGREEVAAVGGFGTIVLIAVALVVFLVFGGGGG